MSILILDSYEITRKGLKLILQSESSDIKEASLSQEGLRLLKSSHIDYTFLDINLGKENGLAFIAAVNEQGLHTQFIVLTDSIKKSDYLKAKALGVRGYILKENSAEDILYGFHKIQKGHKFFDSSLTDQINDISPNDIRHILTQREYDVLCALGKGYSNIQIADCLIISENTVKKHISSVFSKLNLMNRTEAALYVNNL